MSKQRRTYTVQSVENGFDLIAALMLEKEGLKIHSLSRQLGLSSRKVASLLGALEKRESLNVMSWVHTGWDYQRLPWLIR